MINVMIADDHRVVAEGVARLLDDGKTMQVVAIASTLAETSSLLAVHHPDVLLLDVAMPDGDGIDAIPQLESDSPSTQIVMFTMYAEPAVIHRAIKANAHGYLFKSVDADELVDGIRAVVDGKVYLCAEAQMLFENNREVPPTLTSREREILSLIVEGYSIKEIADYLCLGFETIHTYTKYLRQKLDCNNTASMVRIAMERHLV